MRKLTAFLIILLCVSPSVLLAEGNHYGWDKYPTGDTAVTGGVTVGGTTVPLNLPILTTDWTQNTDPTTGDVSYFWELSAPVEIRDGSNILLATIDTMDITVDFDPYVKLNFSVSAASAPVTFTLNSTVVAFPVMADPLAYASAALTLTTDATAGTVAGLYTGDKSYQALYNTGTAYGNLVGNFGVAPYDSFTNSERKPGAPNWDTIAGSVSSIQSQFNFTLSAGDSASGTSRFELKVPEPATMLLLGLGSLALLRKRTA